MVSRHHDSHWLPEKECRRIKSIDKRSDPVFFLIKRREHGIILIIRYDQSTNRTNMRKQTNTIVPGTDLIFLSKGVIKRMG
jgi:hypothetical protein